MRLYSFQIMVEKERDQEDSYPYSPLFLVASPMARPLRKRRNIRAAIEQQMPSPFSHGQPISQERPADNLVC
jgi:hypothetical protein